jgi:hypothetical protein
MATSLGDPAAMRAEAAMLRSQAEALASLAQQLQARVESVEYEGPAATRFRGAMADQGRRAMQLAGELQDLANYVLRAAARVDAQIAEFRRQEELKRQRETESEGW